MTEHHCYHQQRLHTKQCQTAIILFTVYLLVVKCRENVISRRFWSLGIFRILAVHTKNFSQILICQTAYTPPKSLWLTTTEICFLCLLHVGCGSTAGSHRVSSIRDPGWRHSPQLGHAILAGEGKSSDRITWKFLRLLLGREMCCFYSVLVWADSRAESRTGSLFGRGRKYQEGGLKWKGNQGRVGYQAHHLCGWL